MIQSNERVLQDDPLLHWIPDIDGCLQELLRLEGRGDHMVDTVCAQCETGEPVYRCSDCFSPELYCSECVVSIHARSPLHRIQVRICQYIYSLLFSLSNHSSSTGMASTSKMLRSNRLGYEFNWATTSTTLALILSPLSTTISLLSITSAFTRSASITVVVRPLKKKPLSSFVHRGFLPQMSAPKLRLHFVFYALSICLTSSRSAPASSSIEAWLE